MLFLAGAGYEDYEKVKLAWRHPPNAAGKLHNKWGVVRFLGKNKRRLCFQSHRMINGHINMSAVRWLFSFAVARQKHFILYSF